MIKFEKVSYEQFKKDWADTYPSFTEAQIKDIYDSIKLPTRATKGSAGYDFFAPTGYMLFDGKTIKIPTGIRAIMDYGCFLAVYPRSGLGFKYKMRLNNTTGIIDADYAESDNEGHIFIKISNENNEDKTIQIEAGDAFAQGIFLRYLTIDDDDADGQRNGGFGSTSK